jgi:hypothetical protein
MAVKKRSDVDHHLLRDTGLIEVGERVDAILVETNLHILPRFLHALGIPHLHIIVHLIHHCNHATIENQQCEDQSRCRQDEKFSNSHPSPA